MKCPYKDDPIRVMEERAHDYLRQGQETEHKRNLKRCKERIKICEYCIKLNTKRLKELHEELKELNQLDYSKPNK